MYECVCLCVSVYKGLWISIIPKARDTWITQFDILRIQIYTLNVIYIAHKLMLTGCASTVHTVYISIDYKWICKLCKMVRFHQLLHVCTPKTFMYCSVTKQSPPRTFSPTHQPPFANSLSTIFIYLTSGHRPTMIFPAVYLT